MNANKPQLIAPAGNFEKTKTAFAFGADAVYAGIPDFSLRVRINDFNLKSLKQAAGYAHKLGKKIYITINIFAHNKHLDKLPAYIKKLKEIKPDGLIISDPGIIQIIKKNWPKVKITLSTQANCTNWQSAKFWQSQGVSRIVLGRELSLKEINEISKKLPKLELEVFIHGALCMSYSGRCFLSKFYTDRSANLGDCIQPCRWEYKTKKFLFSPEDRKDEILELVEEEHGSYILNSQDLCLVKRLDKLTQAGATHFKIEGRAKSAYYLALVVGSYRTAIDIIYDKKLNVIQRQEKLNFLYKELEKKITHRGYTEGFVFDQGKLAQNIKNSHNISNWEFCGQVDKSVKNKEQYSTYVKVHNSIKLGDEIEIIIPYYDIIEKKVDKLIDSKTKEDLISAHGGQGKIIVIKTKEFIPKHSVLRRKSKA